MELWIRSQDKTKLVKVDNIVYMYSSEDYEKEVHSLWNDCKGILGTYETKERALEVLDEIQKILKPIIKINYEYDDSLPIMNGKWLKFVKEESEIKELSTYVYEMPEN